MKTIRKIDFMKHILLLLTGIAFSCNSYQKTASVESNSESSGKITDPTSYAETITQSELQAHLFTYASDEFEGRATGTPGQKKAVAYIKEAYENLGIVAAKGDGNYFQKVPLEVGQVPSGSIFINGNTFEVGQEVLTFGAASGDYVEMVYVGYGIEEGEYSDQNGKAGRGP